MNQALWIARRNYLLTLIKKVSLAAGGDDEDLLKAHCDEIIYSHPGEKIEEAIKCYEDLADQISYYPKNVIPRGKCYE